LKKKKKNSARTQKLGKKARGRVAKTQRGPDRENFPGLPSVKKKRENFWPGARKGRKSPSPFPPQQKNTKGGVWGPVKNKGRPSGPERGERNKKRQKADRKGKTAIHPAVGCREAKGGR